MSSDRTVVEHLLDGRRALVLELERLTKAVAELDSVIDRIGGSVAFGDPGLVDGSRSQPVSGAGSATRSSGTRTARSAGRARKSGAGKRTGAESGNGQKSIRVHVLEMLAAEDRDFGLAEIIDRIHAAGIQAHDDAVRSITIKLMKDGQVERVGRGMYRLAGRPSAANSTSSPTDAPEPQATQDRQAAGTPVDDYVPPLNLNQPWERQ